MSILQGVLGLVVFIGLAWLLSENKAKVRYKMILAALGLQFAIGFVLAKVPVINKSLMWLNKLVLTLDAATKAGTAFVFGYVGGGPAPFTVSDPSKSFIIAFQILPIILVVSALSSLLFHWGVLQKIIKFFAIILQRVLKTDAATGLGVASSIFMGIVESPLLIKPYLRDMSRSGLFSLITAGMATVAGTVMVLYSNILSNVIENAAGQILIASVMSAPAAIMIAQLMIPPSEEVIEDDPIELKATTKNSFEAIINGTSEGVQMLISISAILIVLFAFIHLINSFLGLFGAITIQKLAGYIFVPFVWLMGIESVDLMAAGQLMGTKVMVNELVAYFQMGSAGLTSMKSKLIMTYAMCGFANFGTLGILIGGMSTIVPERKNEIVSLAFKSIIAGTLATMITGTIIGLLN
jgi:CNT family concentrative nucleoside transporter